MSNIGKTMWSRDHKEKGLIVNESHRWCAGCGAHRPCFIVKWADGKRTKPCISAVKQLNDNEFEIE